MKKVALVCLLVVGCCVAMGATLKVANPFRNWDQAEKIVKAVGAFYKGCQNEEASIIIAELAIMDLAKKTNKDAIPYLEEALEEVEEHDGLRNFTRFLIANAYKEKGDTDKALKTLLSIIRVEDDNEEEDD